MRHRRAGRKLGRNPKHQRALLRSLASALAPLPAAYLLSMSPFGWPLVIAGVLKGVYDLLLLAMFARVRPPEEKARTAE